MAQIALIGSMASLNLATLGVIQYEDRTKKFRTLAHAVLFLDEDRIFEKASPDPKDVFRYSSWREIKQRESAIVGERLEFFVLRWNPKSICAFTRYDRFYKALPANHIIKRVASELESNVRISDWSSPNTFTCKELSLFAESFKQTTFRRLRTVGKQLTVADRTGWLYQYLGTVFLFDIVYGTGMCPQGTSKK